MSAVLDIAEAVAGTLEDYHAEVLFFPEFELRDFLFRSEAFDRFTSKLVVSAGCAQPPYSP